MKHAVILAADSGGMDGGIPAGFAEVDGRPVIEDSIARLEAAGVSDIVIVTGHGAEHYEQLAVRRDGLIRTVHNPGFADSGSMAALYCARDLIDDDFLLLDAELIYESRALEVLIDNEWSDAMLLSGLGDREDAIYVETADGMLVAMSGERSKLGPGIAGERVGIAKISRGLFAVMKHLAKHALEQAPYYAYDADCLVTAARNWEIACPVVPDLQWRKA